MCIRRQQLFDKLAVAILNAAAHEFVCNAGEVALVKLEVHECMDLVGKFVAVRCVVLQRVRGMLGSGVGVKG